MADLVELTPVVLQHLVMLEQRLEGRAICGLDTRPPPLPAVVRFRLQRGTCRCHLLAPMAEGLPQLTNPRDYARQSLPLGQHQQPADAVRNDDAVGRLHGCPAKRLLDGDSRHDRLQPGSHRRWRFGGLEALHDLVQRIADLPEVIEPARQLLEIRPRILFLCRAGFRFRRIGLHCPQLSPLCPEHAIAHIQHHVGRLRQHGQQHDFLLVGIAVRRPALHFQRRECIQTCPDRLHDRARVLHLFLRAPRPAPRVLFGNDQLFPDVDAFQRLVQHVAGVGRRRGQRGAS